MASANSQTVYIDGLPSLACWVYGDAKPRIVIINGGPGYDHTYLQPEWDTLTSVSGIVYYDQRGCGKSGESDNYSWIEHLKDLDRVVEYFSPESKVVLGASSWGTYLALLYSIYYPEKIKGLILSGFTDWIGFNNRKVNLFSYSNDSIGNFRRTFPVSAELDSLMREGFNSSKAPSGTSNSPEMNDPEFGKRFQAYNKDVNRITWNSLRSMPDLTFFNSVNIPVLFLRGSNHCGYPDWSEIVSKQIMNSEVYTIDDSCHDPWFSKPDVFFKKCFEFIARINGSLN